MNGELVVTIERIERVAREVQAVQELPHSWHEGVMLAEIARNLYFELAVLHGYVG